MRFEKVSIAALASLDAPHRISSDDIEEQLAATMDRLGVPRGLLEELSGIRARRFWEEGVQPSDVATRAAELALAESEVPRERIGVLVNTSVCRDYIEPSTACLVHGNLGLPETCMNFDLGNACLAFINGMDIVGNMIERGQIDYGLVVDGEGSRHAIDQTIERLNAADCDEKTFRANFATLTLGSGAAAMLLARRELAPAGHPYLGGVNLASTGNGNNRLCVGQPDKMVTDTKSLMVAGLKLAERTWRAAEQELAWKPELLDHYTVHQVSRAHIGKMCHMLSIDESKVYKLFPEYGNIGPASVPIALDKAWREGLLQAGHRVALMGIGSGLNCTMAEVSW